MTLATWRNEQERRRILRKHPAYGTRALSVLERLILRGGKSSPSVREIQGLLADWEKTCQDDLTDDS